MSTRRRQEELCRNTSGAAARMFDAGGALVRAGLCALGLKGVMDPSICCDPNCQSKVVPVGMCLLPSEAE
jgi:hypothetical protein